MTRLEESDVLGEEAGARSPMAKNVNEDQSSPRTARAPAQLQVGLEPGHLAWGPAEQNGLPGRKVGANQCERAVHVALNVLGAAAAPERYLILAADVAHGEPVIEGHAVHDAARIDHGLGERPEGAARGAVGPHLVAIPVRVGAHGYALKGLGGVAVRWARLPAPAAGDALAGVDARHKEALDVRRHRDRIFGACRHAGGAARALKWVLADGVALPAGGVEGCVEEGVRSDLGGLD